MGKCQTRKHKLIMDTLRELGVELNEEKPTKGFQKEIAEGDAPKKLVTSFPSKKSLWTPWLRFDNTDIDLRRSL